MKAAFDSIDHMALWKLLCSLGLHSKVVDLMEGLYTDTCSCINIDGVMSNWFAVGSGVWQGCRIAPDLFLGPMDHIMERTVHRGIFTHIMPVLVLLSVVRVGMQQCMI